MSSRVVKYLIMSLDAQTQSFSFSGDSTWPTSDKGLFYGNAMGHYRVPFASVSKRVQVRNLSYENQFSTQVHSNANQTHFHMKGFALGLVLTQRQKATREMAYSSPHSSGDHLIES